MNIFLFLFFFVVNLVTSLTYFWHLFKIMYTYYNNVIFLKAFYILLHVASTRSRGLMLF